MFKPIDSHPNFKALEEELLLFWEKNKIFEKSLAKTKPQIHAEEGAPGAAADTRGRGQRVSAQPQSGSNLRESAGKDNVFTFYDGPPFATGLPHYGHILASTIKDVVPRYQTMKGKFVRRRWGWDCHGLPIEELVERELGISGKKDIEEKIGIKKFNETCRAAVLRYTEEWGKTVRRIARWVEFDNAYKTMDTDYMESVWWAFKEVYNKDLVYEGRKVLLYCPRCETPISNFEVAMDNSYKTITDESVIVKFKVQNPRLRRGFGGQANVKSSSNDQSLKSPVSGLRSPVYFLAWTTTPWTLPGNLALAVGKDIDYAVIESNGENYILAKDLVEKVFEPTTYNLQPTTYKGRDLVGLEYEPLYDLRPRIATDDKPLISTDSEQIPTDNQWKSEAQISGNQRVYKVYPADFVNTEDGTGIVHTAVVYGEDDYELGQREGLPVVPLLDEKGIFNELAPEFIRGVRFKESEPKIIKELESRGLLFKKEQYTHSYPHCWRCESPLIYNAIPAWFVNIQKIKKELLKSNDKEINWYPEHLKHGRYEKSVDAAPDWNISRNRYWGNPIPVWRCLDCKKDTVIGSIDELKEKATSDIEPLLMRRGRGGHSKRNSKINYDPPHIPPREGGKTPEGFEIDLHRPYIDEVILKCDECGGEAKRITEIFDSWFEAGSMPFASVHWPFESPSPNPSHQGRGNTQESSSPLTHSTTLRVTLSKAEKVMGEDRGGGDFVYPAQFVAEYIAQTRAWFYVMHVIGLTMFGKAPFENVVTTGTILAEDGAKMSKSKNNFPDPWEVIEKYGVDSLRFYLMNSAVMQADNLNFSERDLQTVSRKVFRILWNVLNYFVTYYDAKTAKDDAKTAKIILDEWLDARTQEFVNLVTGYLDNYDTVRATREMESYINDLSTWYIRRSRGRVDPAFFAVLRGSLITLSKVIAPVMPYIAEKIYGNLKVSATDAPLPRREGLGEGEVEDVSRPSAVERDVAEGGSPPLSVHLTDWPEAKKLSKSQQNLLAEMARLRDIVEKVHALRAQAGIKLRQPLSQLTIPVSDSDNPLQLPLKLRGRVPPLKLRGGKGELLEILKDEVNVKEVEFGDKLELSTEISTELKIEGLAAELQRQINNFRKESGLKIGEMAELYYEITRTEDAEQTQTDAEPINLSRTPIRDGRATGSVPIHRLTAQEIEKAFALVDKEKVYASKISNHSSLITNPDYETEVEIGSEKAKLFLKTG